MLLCRECVEVAKEEEQKQLEKAENRVKKLEKAKDSYEDEVSTNIEKEAESYLVKHNVNLKADVLVAPHHGSHTSSSQQFLEAVSPSVVLFSTGYRNHYHFPHPTVSKRYQAMGVLMLNTAIVGEIDIAEGITLYRNAHQHWWSR